MYLFDTMIVSEPFKNRSNEVVLGWIGSVPETLAYLSVVTLGEMERGLWKLRSAEKQEPIRYGRWIEETIRRYRGRILPIDVPIARRFGKLSFDCGNSNPDLFIAATALEHDLTVVTRNVRHFEPTGVKLFNPYEA